MSTIDVTPSGELEESTTPEGKQCSYIEVGFYFELLFKIYK